MSNLDIFDFEIEENEVEIFTNVCALCTYILKDLELVGNFHEIG